MLLYQTFSYLSSKSNQFQLVLPAWSQASIISCNFSPFSRLYSKNLLESTCQNQFISSLNHKLANTYKNITSIMKMKAIQLVSFFIFALLANSMKIADSSQQSPVISKEIVSKEGQYDDLDHMFFSWLTGPGLLPGAVTLHDAKDVKDLEHKFFSWLTGPGLLPGAVTLHNTPAKKEDFTDLEHKFFSWLTGPGLIPGAVTLHNAKAGQTGKVDLTELQHKFFSWLTGPGLLPGMVTLHNQKE